MRSFSYRPGQQQLNTDTFSCQPLPTVPAEIPELDDTALLFHCLNINPLSASKLKTYTNHYQVLSKVRNYMLQGWPSSLYDEEYLPYIDYNIKTN